MGARVSDFCFKYPNLKKEFFFFLGGGGGGGGEARINEFFFKEFKSKKIIFF